MQKFKNIQDIRLSPSERAEYKKLHNQIYKTYDVPVDSNLRASLVMAKCKGVRFYIYILLLL